MELYARVRRAVLVEGCQAAAERGILLAPGDCFDTPSHFRLGFAAAGDNFSKALDRFGAFVKRWSAKMVTA